jgi:hypothetical protein
MGDKRLKRRKSSGRGKIKAPEGKPLVNYDLNPPLFSLSHVATSHCITSCETPDRAAFASRIRELSQLTWRQIKSTGRHGLGFEKIPRDKLRVGVPETITEDVKFIAFRFSGMKPMIGYRVNDIFHVIWFDRSLDVYDHGN